MRNIIRCNFLAVFREIRLGNENNPPGHFNLRPGVIKDSSVFNIS